MFGVRTRVRSLSNSEIPRLDNDMDLFTGHGETKHEVRLFMVNPTSQQEIDYVTKVSKGLINRDPIYYYFGHGMEGIMSSLIYLYRNPKMEGQIVATYCCPNRLGEMQISNAVYCEQDDNQSSNSYLRDVGVLNRELLLSELDSKTVNQRIDTIKHRYGWTEIVCE